MFNIEKKSIFCINALSSGCSARGVLSKSLTMNSVVLPHAVMARCLASWKYWIFWISRYTKNECSPPTPSCYKTLTLTTNPWHQHFSTGMLHQKLGKNNKICIDLTSQIFSFLLLYIVNRNYKTRTVLLLSYMHRYNFSFNLRLATTLI